MIRGILLLNLQRPRSFMPPRLSPRLSTRRLRLRLHPARLSLRRQQLTPQSRRPRRCDRPSPRPRPWSLPTLAAARPVPADCLPASPARAPRPSLQVQVRRWCSRWPPVTRGRSRPVRMRRPSVSHSLKTSPAPRRNRPRRQPTRRWLRFLHRQPRQRAQARTGPRRPSKNTSLRLWTRSRVSRLRFRLARPPWSPRRARYSRPPWSRATTSAR